MGAGSTFRVDRLASPVGPLSLVVDADHRLCALEFDADDARLMRALELNYGERSVALETGTGTSHVLEALEAYFAGDPCAIDALAIRAGGTPFQRLVWTALRTIPSGTTTTYGQLARAIGRPNASRAVGLANGANPIAIVVPCHRVIGANGTLTGYGGGIERKRWLLDHEQRRAGELSEKKSQEDGKTRRQLILGLDPDMRRATADIER